MRQVARRFIQGKNGCQNDILAKLFRFMLPSRFVTSVKSPKSDKHLGMTFISVAITYVCVVSRRGWNRVAWEVLETTGSM
jgi:hypothetical protein